MADSTLPFAFLTQEQHPSTSAASSSHSNNHRRSSSSSSHHHPHHHHNILSAILASASSHSTSSPTPSPTTPSSAPSSSSSVFPTISSPMPKLFKVEIANNGDCKSSSPIFYPSDLIQGMVYLYLDKPMTLPALKIVFRGESNYPSSKQQDHLDHHMRRLFSVAMTLWGSREALPEDQWGQLPAGNHIFPFTVQLPDKNLPASFDHPWLKNQYTLTAYYRRPNGLSKWQSKAKAVNFMPLSAPGLEHGPIQESCPKMGTALLLSHPDLTPGGRVHVKLTAAAAIDRCQFALSRHIRARINETTYKEDEVICHYERKSIPKGEFSLVLPIPKVTPPTTESSSALKITYSVQVSIWNERFFFKTESHNFDFPIVIRTLPSCDNRTCEGLDWCEPSVDRPMFLTEVPMQPLPLYDAEQSPPQYSNDLPDYDEATHPPSTLSSSSSSSSSPSTPDSASIHSITDRDTTVAPVSAMLESVSLVADHPPPHHPSCRFYTGPEQTLQDEISSSLTAPLASMAIINGHPAVVRVAAHDSFILRDGPNLSTGESSGASADASQTGHAEASAHSGSNPPPPPQSHAQAVEFLKVQTVIEPST